MELCARHPLARAVRVDKLSLAALAATLELYHDPEHARREIPVLSMLETDPELLRARAERLAAASGGVVVESSGRVGGGALPLLELTGPVAEEEVELAVGVLEAARAGGAPGRQGR